MKLSIITINYNNRTGLERTLQSVENQNTRDFEHVIIDGASTDGSAEDIRKYAENKPNVIWVSEPDSGIYNAMNKGAKLASGEYLLFLNSGDDLYSSHVVQDFNKSEINCDLVQGYMMYVDPHTGKKEISHTGCGNQITLSEFFEKSLPHPATFITRKLQLSSLYNENYKIVSDAQIFLKNLILKNCSYQEIDIIVSNFYTDGISSKRGDILREEGERMKAELIPPRILIDYQGITVDGLIMLKLLSNFSGFRNFIIKYNIFLIKLYSFFKSNKNN